jgi:hypothetical protein
VIITYYNPYAICHRHMYELSKLILMAIFVGKTIRIQVGPDVFFFVVAVSNMDLFSQGFLDF